MAFGIEIGGQMFFATFALMATVVIFIYIVRARNEKPPLRIALALILGGAVGNLIDRLLYGKVVDFLEVGYKDLRWPIFNVADSAVTIGMIILVTLIFFDKKAADEEEKVSTEKNAFS
jgi:signal peptidase II